MVKKFTQINFINFVKLYLKLKESLLSLKIYLYIIKPVYNGQPWDPKIVAVVDRWSLFRGRVNL